MNEEIKFALNKLNNAYLKLEEGVKIAKEELEKDGVVQRFEFSFELLWKTLKIFLKDSGIEVKTPRDSFKEAFKVGWVVEEKVFLNMLDDRNKTSHIYDKVSSEKIFNRIKKNYSSEIAKIIEQLKNFTLEAPPE